MFNILKYLINLDHFILVTFLNIMLMKHKKLGSLKLNRGERKHKKNKWLFSYFYQKMKNIVLLALDSGYVNRFDGEQ